MEDTVKGQLSGSAAEVYETFFVPALFAEWAPRVADAAVIAAGQVVLDVACGTGVLAAEAAHRVGSAGRAIGLDCNEGMLAVAARRPAAVEWRRGAAEALPFDKGAFDAVVSQFGLMFFDDRAAALREMWRVLRPGGRLAVAVWAGLDRAPGYAAMVGLLDRLFGATVADQLRAPYSLGDPAALRALFAAAGIPDSAVAPASGAARFPSIEAWVRTDVKGWTLADMIDEAQYAALQAAAPAALAGFVQPGGRVEFGHGAYVVTAAKR
ncbi:MAG: methyltransferase domain-containing protein [Rhodospirillales bacterium]